MSAKFLLLDDYGTTAGQAGSPGAAASGEVLFGPFVANNVADAVTVAFLFASIAQRPVRVAPVGSAPPYTLVTGQVAATALTSVPSGVGY
jgi:hypothetical protein